MANAYPVMNATENLIREISGTKNWLMGLEGKADVRWDSSTIMPGDYTVVVVDNATANVANKASTSVVADQGVRHNATVTTKNYYQPVKMYAVEMETAIRNGTLDQYTMKDIAKQVDAVMKATSTTIVDALSDGALTKTATLANGNTNFAAGTEAKQIANMEKFGSVFGQVVAYNDGMLPDWVIAQTTAYGNLATYSMNAARGIARTPNGPTAFEILSVPMYSQPNGTNTKWGAASKPCVLMGSNRHIIFAMRSASAGVEFMYDTAVGAWVLPIDITISYGVDFTSSTGLALGIGEVINGAS